MENKFKVEPGPKINGKTEYTIYQKTGYVSNPKNVFDKIGGEYIGEWMAIASDTDRARALNTLNKLNNDAAFRKSFLSERDKAIEKAGRELGYL